MHMIHDHSPRLLYQTETLAILEVVSLSI